MKKLLSFSFSKIYIIVMILISLLVVGGYFSYAMFTVSKERSNAISIVTGNLIYDLTVDGEDIEKLTVPAGTTKVFTVVLSNPNNRIARFNFYYLGTLSDGVSIGYSLLDGGMVTPVEAGVNLEKSGTSGSSNTYRIVVVNDSENEITINLGISVGLDYNDLSLPSNGHLFEPVKRGPVGDVVVTNPGENGSTYDDEVDTLLTGEEPDNYIWYSGKLWRAVSVNDEDNTVKLVTEWNISSNPYDDSSNKLAGSYMEEWLNDTTVDGFLGNLRDYENFIKLDNKWNATMMTDTSKPPSTTIVEDTVGLLNLYEYTMSYNGTTKANGYLNNGLHWWTITPSSDTTMYVVNEYGNLANRDITQMRGIRPSIVLKNNIEIVEGNGTEENPYRLKGDNDKDLNGVKLNTRYSGEYIRFGNDENNLYRIVSHEVSDLTKIVSAIPLKNGGAFIKSSFGSNNSYSSTNTIGTFLNGTYLNSYLTAGNRNMIVTNTTWYLGSVNIMNSTPSYKLAKYKDVNMSGYTKSTISTIGLLRYGELMSGEFDRYGLKGSTSVITNLTIDYWLLTPERTNYVYYIYNNGGGINTLVSYSCGIKPALNLKENVIITGGDGTKNNPFELSV